MLARAVELAARGQLTLELAALHTGLTLDETESVLTQLVERGFLERSERRGVVAYTVPSWDALLAPAVDTGRTPSAPAEAERPGHWPIRG